MSRVRGTGMPPSVFVAHRRWLILALHLVLVPVSYLLAFGIRFDFDIPRAYLDVALVTLPLLLAARISSFWLFRLFQGWWRHAGLRDLADLLKGVSLSSGVFLCLLFFTQQLDMLPRSILVLDWVTAVLVFGGARFAVRALREEAGLVRSRNGGGVRTLMVGAGDSAEHLLRQFRRSGSVDLAVVGLVDDDPAKQGMHLHGVSVLGGTAALPELVSKLDVRMIVIAIPSASREEIRAVVDRCIESGVEFKIVPSIREILAGKARLSELRDVQVEDLLGRPPIRLDLTEVEEDLNGRVVLVTGGAGSIGSELARQVAGFGPAKLVVLDQAESPLYFVHLELMRTHPGLEIVPVIADVTDSTRLEEVLAAHRPSYVFHAAAYKHVPLMEQNVVEAVRNNILGTLRVASCASRHGCEKFVLISTDKAVNPSSVMGASKRIAERIVLGWPALRNTRCDFRAVRFGNVLGSDGSVVPLFRKQMAQGGPLTVTHPEVTRYFMTIPEAVQLVLQAAALPEARGRISMLDMGEPVRIVELAENMIRLSGLEPYRDVPIVFTGLRPGEKLREELMSEVEETIPTKVQKIRIVQTDEPEGRAVEAGLDRLLAAAEIGRRADLLLAIRALVPECVPPLREATGAPRPVTLA